MAQALFGCSPSLYFHGFERFSSSRTTSPDLMRCSHLSFGRLHKFLPVTSRVREPFSDQRQASTKSQATSAQNLRRVGKVLKWWEKGLQSNMKEIDSARDLVDSLMTAEDSLVIVDFFSPGCGGCRSLHPKICKFAEENPDVLFLQVNYEKHKSLCYALRVHVLPFFRFYRGSEGRICSFSCTNATLNKFRNSLAKCKVDTYSRGPVKGLEEWELLALSANPDVSFQYKPKPGVCSPQEHISSYLPSLQVQNWESTQDALATAGR